MCKQLIIPSATIIPDELQSVGKLPAIIYPFHQGIVFDHLFRQYQSACDQMKVICYEKADKVHRRLLNYKSDKICIIDLPELRDLGYSVYYGLEGCYGTVIINFADTIVFDNLFEEAGDAFYYNEDFRSEIWTFFQIEKGIIRAIFDKVPPLSNESNAKEKFFVGVFQISDAAAFRDCLSMSLETFDNRTSSFYRGLMAYSKAHPFKAVKTANWLDIGHADKYFNSKLEVSARSFNHITIDKDRGILRKTSDDVEKFIGEIKWYLRIPEDIAYVSPRIFSYSTSYAQPYVSMEYYSYHTVHELFLYGDLRLRQWIDIFNRIRFVYNDFQRFTVHDANLQISLEEVYLKKTLDRLMLLKRDERFLHFFSHSVSINGKRYKSLNCVMDKLRILIPKMLYDIDHFSIIHGDFCFTNIMVDGNLSFIKLIDPRGKFGAYDIYGDPRYDLSKLFHSIDGKYDFIIKDYYSLRYDLISCTMVYKIQDRERDFNIYHVFKEVFSQEIGENLQKYELIESLLFFSMIPLHNEKIEHQLIMMGQAYEILNRVEDIMEVMSDE